MTPLGALCVIAYGAAAAYVVVIRPVRKAAERRHQPLYEIKDGKVYRA